MTERLRVAIATPLRDDLVDFLREAEPRLDYDHRPDLAGPADVGWTTPWSRPEELQGEYEAFLDDADILYGVPDQSGRALGRTVAANPRLRWVHTIPAGGGAQVRSAKLPAADLDRIVFTTSAGVHAQSLAEFALFGVIAGAKQLPRLRAAQSRHAWADRQPMGLLTETTVAIVGLGSIGRYAAELFARTGMTVIGVHRRELDVPGVSRIEPVERLGAVLAESDAVLLCLPDTPSTRGILGRDELAAARPGITVVNVGRGSSIDEPALIEALRSGQVGSAVLDVTATEPLPPESPLWNLPEVVIAPHTAAITRHEPRRIAELFADNARRLLDGEPLRNVVDTVEFY